MISKKAFTLIELLVVVAILSLILSIILVSLADQRQKARIARGLQFSQSIHHALGAYAVGLWRFDEGQGTTAYDASGYGNHGEIHGASYIADTPSGRDHSLSFNGTDARVSTSLDLNNSLSWTYVFWINVKRSVDGSDEIINGGYHNPRIFFATNRIQIGYRNAVNEYKNDILRTAINLNNWHHIALSWDGSYLKSYKDGLLDQNIEITDGMWDHRSYVGFGYRWGNPIDGLLDDVRIYEKALAVSQIEYLYYAGLDNLLAKGLISEQEYQERL